MHCTPSKNPVYFIKYTWPSKLGLVQFSSQHSSSSMFGPVYCSSIFGPVLTQYSFPIMLCQRARSSMVGPVYLTQYKWSSNSVCIALYAGLSMHSHYFRPIWKFQYARSTIVHSVFQTQYVWPSMFVPRYMAKHVRLISANS